MKRDTNTFHFELSLTELSWLAGAFGITSLPLPMDALQDMTRSQLIEDQKKGHASLLTRGLIRPSPSFGWQVERLPAAIVQWMASAASVLRAERIERNGAKFIVHIFMFGEQALSVEINGNTAAFTLYKTRAALKKAIKIWLKIPAKCQKPKETFSIPQPQAFFPIVWKDQNLAAKILDNADLPTNPKALIEWAKNKDWMTVMNKIQIDGEIIKVAGQLILCADELSLWNGSSGKQKINSSTAMFFAMSGKELDVKIEEML